MHTTNESKTLKNKKKRNPIYSVLSRCKGNKYKLRIFADLHVSEILFKIVETQKCLIEKCSIKKRTKKE